MHDCQPSRVDLSMLLFVLAYLGFVISAGKITALLAVSRRCGEHSGNPLTTQDARKGTLVHSRATLTGGEH
jgi:hypothetical protein